MFRAFYERVDLALFWRMTPWQFDVLLEASKKRTRDDNYRDRWFMYSQATLNRVVKMPPIADVLAGADGPSAPGKKKSPQIDEAAITERMKRYMREFKKQQVNDVEGSSSSG